MNNIGGGEGHPIDPKEYNEWLEKQAVRLLQDHIRDALVWLVKPTQEVVEMATRSRITATLSVGARALTLMADTTFFDALFKTIRQEVEEEEHQEFLLYLQQQIHEQEQEEDIQMSLPLGPEWDPPEEVAVIKEKPAESIPEYSPDYPQFPSPAR